MKISLLISASLIALCAIASRAQTRKLPLNGTDGLLPFQIQISVETYLDKPSVRVVDVGNATSDMAFAKLKNLRFRNGTVGPHPIGSAGC